MKPRARGAILSSISVALSLGLGATPALADTVELKNGRRIEGKIVSRNEAAVRIQVEGGCIDLPRHQIAEITDAPTADDEYGERFQNTPLDDPRAIDALASWARSKGLEAHARQLAELASGVRLEQGFDGARAEGTVDGYLRLEAWARQEGFSFEVRRLALSNAQKLDPGSPLVRRGLATIEGEERAASALARARARARPSASAAAAAALAARERDLAERERAVSERERLERERAEAAAGGDPRPGDDTRDDGVLLLPRGRVRIIREPENGTDKPSDKKPSPTGQQPTGPQPAPVRTLPAPAPSSPAGQPPTGPTGATPR
jgi:hypothetical protein